METDDQILTAFEWTDEDMIALSDAVIADGKCLLPAGANKYFNMFGIQRNFEIRTKKKAETKVLWDKLHDLYDIQKLDEIVPWSYPNDPCEFSLPESDFSQLIRDRKNQSSQDKANDDESRDSGSGRETPPTLPIAKRGAAIQSSLSSANKRKSSFSDAGSDGGRKSTGGTKSKRRI